MQRTKPGGRFWTAMLIFGLMGQVAWVVENMYFNVFIYKMFHAQAADISAMVMASAVVAALTTIVMGAVSDKLGQRKAFMSAGYLIWGVRIIGQVFIPGLIGPAIGAAVLKNAETIVNADGTESFLPNANIWLAALIVVVILAAGLVPALRRGGRTA